MWHTPGAMHVLYWEVYEPSANVPYGVMQKSSGGRVGALVISSVGGANGAGGKVGVAVTVSVGVSVEANVGASVMPSVGVSVAANVGAKVGGEVGGMVGSFGGIAWAGLMKSESGFRSMEFSSSGAGCGERTGGTP